MPAGATHRKGRRTKNEINMVPFIDVMLVLLIIFMVTAPLITPSQIKLPSVGQADRQPERFVQVMIDKDGGLKVKSSAGKEPAQSVSARELVSQVQTLQGPPAPEGEAAVPVVISADKDVKYDTVVTTMAALQKAGVQRVGLSVQTTR